MIIELLTSEFNLFSRDDPFLLPVSVFMTTQNPYCRCIYTYLQQVVLASSSMSEWHIVVILRVVIWLANRELITLRRTRTITLM